MLLVGAGEIREPPGEGLTGRIANQTIRVTNRRKLLLQQPMLESVIPPTAGGLECVVLIDEVYAATIRFRDQPRQEGKPFIDHLKPKHHFDRVILMSGDRESEVRYLAEAVGIDEVFASQSPEQKWTLVKELTKNARTLFVEMASTTHQHSPQQRWVWHSDRIAMSPPKRQAQLSWTLH